jgi:hypothetical protein
MWWTLRGVNDWTKTTWDEVKTLTNQKTLEDSLLDTKHPETLTMILEPQLAAKAFTDMLILLSKMWGIAGHPLNYVLRSNLKGPNHADIDNEHEDPPPFGQPGSPYFLIDDKLCRWAPILRSDLTHLLLGTCLKTLESDGPFEPRFLANMVTVYNVLHASWGKSSWWSHMTKFSRPRMGDKCTGPYTLFSLVGKVLCQPGAPS